MAKHRVLIGINYPGADGGEKRAEPGDVVGDLPEKSAKWMLAQGIIEVVGKVAAAAVEEVA